MIRGYYAKRIDRLAHEICIYDEVKNEYITFEFKAHKANHEGMIQETTLIRIDDGSDQILKALGEVMIQMGLLNDSATTAELKATKYHLEDMRKLTFTPPTK